VLSFLRKTANGRSPTIFNNRFSIAGGKSERLILFSRADIGGRTNRSMAASATGLTLEIFMKRLAQIHSILHISHEDRLKAAVMSRFGNNKEPLDYSACDTPMI